ncbi:MAG: serine/threonine protein kinase [Polyangiaceae bacterium]|nr:serine/threonine protein kinase [Polyangiaceae bacterium]
MSDWLEPGLVIDGRYRLERRLGTGAMGEVWVAEHQLLRSPCAVKVIRADHTNEDAEARFLREAQAAARIPSTHVVKVFDFGIFEGNPYLAMELLQGEALDERLARVKRLSLADTARIYRQVCRGIEQAHAAGIVHRDLKPANLFLTRDGDSEVVKILDFGIAKTLGVDWSDDESTAAGQLLGTPYCLSPEQAMGNAIDYRADLWSLGVIMFQSFTGRKPFRGTNLTDLLVSICTADPPKPSEVVECPVELDQWFERALQRNPANRYQSASELYQAFAAAIGIETHASVDESIPPPAIAAVEQTPAQRPSYESTQHTAALNVSAPRRSRWGGLVAAGSAAVVLLGVLGWRLATGRAGDAPDAGAAPPVPSEALRPARLASASQVAGETVDVPSAEVAPLADSAEPAPSVEAAPSPTQTTPPTPTVRKPGKRVPGKPQKEPASPVDDDNPFR